MVACRFELKPPIGSVDVLELFWRTIVILRPEIEVDWLLGTKRVRFRRGCFGALLPRPAIVVEGIQGREESVDVPREFARIRQIGRRNVRKRVGTIKTDDLSRC